MRSSLSFACWAWDPAIRKTATNSAQNSFIMPPRLSPAKVGFWMVAGKSEFAIVHPLLIAAHPKPFDKRSSHRSLPTKNHSDARSFLQQVGELPRQLYAKCR